MSSVLNAELPQNSRTHIIEAFNQGVFDILITTDELNDSAKGVTTLSKMSRKLAQVESGNEEEEDDDMANDDEDEGEADNDEFDDNDEIENAINEENEDEVDNDEELDDDGDEADQEINPEEGDEIDIDDDDDDEEGSEAEADNSDNEDGEDDESMHEDDEPKSSSSKPLSKKQMKAKTKAAQAEFGVSRGIDFKAVETVVNFDFPESAEAYVHRAGRTARAAASGTCLSLVRFSLFIYLFYIFVFTNSEYFFSSLFFFLLPQVTHAEQRLLAKVQQLLGKGSNAAVIEDFAIRMEELQSFKYRVEDSLRSVTRAAVREARATDIKRELLSSEKLRAHFEDNPNDKEALKEHAKHLRPSKIQVCFTVLASFPIFNSHKNSS
jgi:ATP-dependent RNA helicase DDX56/DBP9